MMTFEKLNSVSIASSAEHIGATIARFFRKEDLPAEPRPVSPEALSASGYVDLLSDELDRQAMTKAEQQDCASLNRIRSALYSD
jgi:hypothetical protein